MKNNGARYDVTLIYADFAKSRKTALACDFLLTKQAFHLSAKYFQKIVKQLLNLFLAGHEESLRPLADSTNLCLNSFSYPAQPRSVIV